MHNWVSVSEPFFSGVNGDFVCTYVTHGPIYRKCVTTPISTACPQKLYTNTCMQFVSIHLARAVCENQKSVLAMHGYFRSIPVQNERTEASKLTTSVGKNERGPPLSF